jgi:hypothetical protein
MLIIRDNLQTVFPATQIDGNRGMYIHVPVDQFRQPLSRDITGFDVYKHQRKVSKHTHKCILEILAR